VVCVERDHAGRGGTRLSGCQRPQHPLDTRLCQRAGLGARDLVARNLRLARREDGEGRHERGQDGHDDQRHRQCDSTFVPYHYSFLTLTRPATTAERICGAPSVASSDWVVSRMSIERTLAGVVVVAPLTSR